MKKNFSYVLICICCFMLCGCTEYPSMSDADLDLVAEYAAGILLQNSESAENRLMDIEDALLALEEEQQKEQEEEVEKPIEPEKELEDKEEELTEAETPVIDNTEKNEEMAPSAPLNSAMGVDVLTVQLSGYEIKESYMDGVGGFIALDAKAGNKLFVAKLVLTNNTDNSVEINMLEKSNSFKVSLDGSGYKFVLSTMLPDDLSTYIGTLGAGEATELVLISEWKEEEFNNITNPTLYIRNGELSGYYPIQ